ncbi:MAG: DUF6636 domain-containing protein [Thermoleophilaceae bacterium]
MRRLAAVLLLVPLLAGCGSGGDTTTVTTTAPEPPAADTTPATGTGANDRPPPARSETSERIDVGDSFFFQMPSKHIGCAVTANPTTLRCDTTFPTRFSRTGHTCEAGDYGQAFQISENGRARAICAGDTVLSAPGERTFPYGKTWLLGPFICMSRPNGLTCRSSDGHGFALSLQAQKLF